MTIPNTKFVAATPTILGGSISVTIDRDSSGRLWAAWATAHEVRYSISDDEGLTWSPPAQVPTQAGNSVMDGAGGDLASVIAFGDSVGIAWGDHDELPAVANDGYYFSVIDAGDDPATAANWSLEKLPTLLPSASESADNYLNLKATSDGTVYMVGKDRQGHGRVRHQQAGAAHRVLPADDRRRLVCSPRRHGRRLQHATPSGGQRAARHGLGLPDLSLW